MRAISMRVLSLSVCLWFGMAGIGIGTGIGAGTGMLHAADASHEKLQPEIEAWIAYVYSAEREQSWSSYASVVARHSQQAAALQKFGMVAADTAEQLAALQQQAEERRVEQQHLMEAAYEAIALRYAWKPSGDASIVAADPPDQNDSEDPAGTIAASEIDAAELLAALNQEDKAGRDARAADVLLKTGSMDVQQYLAKQEVYLQARLQASAAKETFVRASVSSFQSGDRQLISLHEWLASLQRDGGTSLIEGWMGAAMRYAAVPYGTELGSGMRPATLPGGFAGADGKPVEMLSYTAVALIGAPVRLSAAAPPFLSASGEVYVPLRPYAEAMHYRVEWDAKHDQLRLTRSGEKIEVRLGQTQAAADGQTVELPGQTYVRNGYTYVPLSFLSGVTGSDVYWHEALRQGIITMRVIGDVE
jgi:hypothetical protein